GVLARGQRRAAHGARTLLRLDPLELLTLLLLPLLQHRALLGEPTAEGLGGELDVLLRVEVGQQGCLLGVLARGVDTYGVRRHVRHLEEDRAPGDRLLFTRGPLRLRPHLLEPLPHTLAEGAG